MSYDPKKDPGTTMGDRLADGLATGAKGTVIGGAGGAVLGTGLGALGGAALQSVIPEASALGDAANATLLGDTPAIDATAASGSWFGPETTQVFTTAMADKIGTLSTDQLAAISDNPEAFRNGMTDGLVVNAAASGGILGGAAGAAGGAALGIPVGLVRGGKKSGPGPV